MMITATTRTCLLCFVCITVSCSRCTAAPADPEISQRGIVKEWANAEAYGSIHPEDCIVIKYNPSIRLLVAMGMLLFPIVFFVSYQYCCSGDQICDCIRGRKAQETAASSLSTQMKQYVGTHQQAKVHFQALALKAQASQASVETVDKSSTAKAPNALLQAVLASVNDPSRKVAV